MNADWLLTSALAPGMEDLSSPGGEGWAGAEPGQSQGLAQAPREKTNREAAITSALALLRHLWLGFVPAVPAMPEPGRDTGHFVPRARCQPLPAQPPGGTPVPRDPTPCCHSPSPPDKGVKWKQMTQLGELGGRHSHSTG